MVQPHVVPLVEYNKLLEKRSDKLLSFTENMAEKNIF